MNPTYDSVYTDDPNGEPFGKSISQGETSKVSKLILSPHKLGS
jgi:hypothetical protein